MILPEDPRPGLVLCYAYLWSTEFDAGRREGLKDRPAVVVLARHDLGPSTVLYVAPVTHSVPGDPRYAVEIPAVVKNRLGMDGAASFILATEMNVLVWPGPDLRPIRRSPSGSSDTLPCAYGYLPGTLFRSLKAAIAYNHRRGTAEAIKR